ncbi:MAG: acyl-CoA hydrolase [Myxococcota bacterium]|jgi:acyl-CoA hydrolase
MTELAARRVRDSEITLVRGMTLLDANHLGNVHGGVIMRMVDDAAGTAAARHAGRAAVTASVDELSFLGPVNVGDLVTVKARVNAVGRTSMEVGARVEAEPLHGGTRRHTTTAYLTFVALDLDGRPAEVPPLLTESDEEERREAQAQIRRQVRKDRIARLGSWRPDSALDDVI